MAAKILVVEDTLDMREMFHLYLTTEGFTVVTASDGREALYLASAERPDLMITDIHMPHLDGIQLVKELRAQPKFKDLPIIGITAFGLEGKGDILKAGADRAVAKPQLFDSLINAINELLNERKK